MATGFAAPPATPTEARMFGQVGVGTITSSPPPTAMRTAVSIAIMPEPVMKNRSGSKLRP